MFDSPAHLHYNEAKNFHKIHALPKVRDENELNIPHRVRQSTMPLSPRQQKEKKKKLRQKPSEKLRFPLRAGQIFIRPGSLSSVRDARSSNIYARARGKEKDEDD